MSFLQVTVFPVPPEAQLPPLSAGHLCLTVRGPYGAQCPSSKWHLPSAHVPRPCKALSFMYLQSREAVLKFLRTMWSLIFMAKKVHLLRMFLPKLLLNGFSSLPLDFSWLFLSFFLHYSALWTLSSLIFSVTMLILTVWVWKTHTSQPSSLKFASLQNDKILNENKNSSKFILIT